jgi:hypothetical protein
MYRIQRHGSLHVFHHLLGVAIALAGASVTHAAEEQPASKPVWPDNGVAQRMLPGAYNMFVEKDDQGQWHAWAMNGDGEDAQALDFFSGKQMHVKAGLLDNGQQSRDFVDTAGGVHTPQDKGFMFTLSGAGGLPGGIEFGGDDFSLEGAADTNCSTSFISVKGGVSDDDPMAKHPKWKKVPIYHVAARKGGCPSGYLRSSISTALDLEDGTFLVTMNCWVFRLRKSDLSPVGSASGLRIVGESALQAAIEQAKGKNIQDVTNYLSKALNLSFDAANSCKSGF